MTEHNTLWPACSATGGKQPRRAVFVGGEPVVHTGRALACINVAYRRDIEQVSMGLLATSRQKSVEKFRGNQPDATIRVLKYVVDLFAMQSMINRHHA